MTNLIVSFIAGALVASLTWVFIHPDLWVIWWAFMSGMALQLAVSMGYDALSFKGVQNAFKK